MTLRQNDITAENNLKNENLWVISEESWKNLTPKVALTFTIFFSFFLRLKIVYQLLICLMDAPTKNVISRVLVWTVILGIPKMINILRKCERGVWTDLFSHSFTLWSAMLSLIFNFCLHYIPCSLKNDFQTISKIRKTSVILNFSWQHKT